jgi:uncharacterized membrane protein
MNGVWVYVGLAAIISSCVCICSCLYHRWCKKVPRTTPYVDLLEVR